MDTTQDISKIDQVSFVVRYADFIKDNDNVNIIRDVVIREVFLGFEECMGQSAEDMVKQLLLFFENNNLSFERLRAQGYDGAANMSGVYNGLQAKILEKQPNALYVHCAAHNLNLVINDSVKISRELQNFYDFVESLYAFFAHSIKRWAVLTEMFESKKHTLKRLCPTRWSSRYDSLHSLRFHYREILQVLTKLTLTSSKATEQNEALGLKKKLENFETVVLIVMEHKILSITKLVSNALQSKNQDIQRASKLLETAKKDIAEMRNSFEEVINEAADLARGWGINPSFKEHRIRKVKKQLDELSCDERLFNAKENFRVSVFNITLDVIISQLENRFKGLNSVVERFKVIFPSVLRDHSDADLVLLSENLISFYSNDLSYSFSQEIVSFRRVYKDQINADISVNDLANWSERPSVSGLLLANNGAAPLNVSQSLKDPYKYLNGARSRTAAPTEDLLPSTITRVSPLILRLFKDSWSRGEDSSSGGTSSLVLVPPEE
ncbi:zinc finger MYM-type protein 1-like [Sitophilus oryzae]|uniref:Zinc finger MYM-type protein 1-like n=1 Tax=Sitophilus oryzae TaxID=7048 RepID=A0A6J2XGU9_SITOR|nr:zinc finger MYM-type protein 1-like [Sitophilus oryzae]